jgi:hypothetical protein
MLTDLLEDLRHGPVTGERRPGPGIVVRSRDRRVWHHVRYGIDRAALRRQPPRADGRIVRYWSHRLPIDRPTVAVPVLRSSGTDVPAI